MLMNSMYMPFHPRPVLRWLTASVSLVAFVAHAQWQWLDKDGRKVFSDRAPTAEVPEKSILKRPGRPAAAPAATAADDAKGAAATPATNTAGAAANVPKPSGVDKDLEQRKKAAADQEAAKRKADDEKVEKAKAENCIRARSGKQTMDSGVRLSRTNAAGEREILNDDTRLAEAKRIQGIIDTDCKAPG
jgi:hypothetical protein